MLPFHFFLHCHAACSDSGLLIVMLPAQRLLLKQPAFNEAQFLLIRRAVAVIWLIFIGTVLGTTGLTLYCGR